MVRISLLPHWTILLTASSASNSDLLLLSEASALLIARHQRCAGSVQDSCKSTASVRAASVRLRDSSM